MVPSTLRAGLHHVGAELTPGHRELSELFGARHAPAVRGQPMTEDVRHQPKASLLADRAVRLGLGADIASRPNELGMGVADLVPTKTAEANLIDEHPPRQTVIHDPAAVR